MVTCNLVQTLFKKSLDIVKRLNKILMLFTMLLSLAGASSSAQDYDAFFRGQIAPRYMMRFNGTYFWESPPFSQGQKLCYDGRVYDNLTLNVNAHLQELLLIREGDAMAMIVERDNVEWFTLRDTTYVNLNAVGVKEAPKGYYKLLYSGSAMLFEHIDKVILSRTDNCNGAVIGYYDEHYNPNITTCFEKQRSYWYYKDGEITKLKNKKDIKLIYPDKKKQIRKIVNAHQGYGVRLKNASYFNTVVSGIEDSSVQTSVIPHYPFHKERDITRNSGYLETPKGNVPEELITSLPEGWLALSDDGDLVNYVAGSVTKAIHANKTYELGDKTKTGISRATVSGTVYNMSDDEPMPGVTIYDNVTGQYITSDGNGHFSLNLPVGENVINFSEYSVEDFHVKVIVYDNALMDVEMKPKSELLESAMISAESRANHRTAKMGIEKINISSIKKFPTAFGEGDVLKAVQTFPGVQSVGEASGGINVRGGSTDQNLILFNESTIYNPSHMFGIFSSFNPDVVDNVELYKSSIPAEFGGRISSVMDVRSKEGNMQKFKGSVGIGLLTSHAFIEGPLKKERTSFTLGGRTTYSNWMLDLLPEGNGYSGGKAQFNDANAGFTHKFAEDNTLNVNAYWSHDNFSFAKDTSFHYNNVNVTARWKKKISDETSFALSGGYDWYETQVNDLANVYDAYSIQGVIRQAYTKLGFTHKLNDDHTLSYGGQLIGYALDRGNMDPLNTDEFEEFGIKSYVIPVSLGTEFALEPSLWMSDTWQIDDKLSFDYGTRLSSFLATKPMKFYALPELRLSGKYSFNPNLSVKGGFNTMNQYIHMVSNTTTVSPMDTWKLSDKDIRPQRGFQGAAGAYWSIDGGKIDLSLETYYKRMYNYLDYKSGATLVMNENIADALVETTGRAYGAEFMFKKPLGKLNGWVSYTYSRTMLKEMHDRGVSTINSGKWYPAAFDKPHDVKVVGNYKFTHRYSLSFNLDYSTGRPVTIPVGRYFYGGGYRLAYSDRNGYRIPDYFRLDLALNFEPSHYLRKLTYFSVTLGVYNVTGRNNAYSVYYTTKGGTRLSGYMVSVFACQIPYLNINMRF